ncbi:MAG TPA: hypothetical protein VHW65_13515 [Gemmatimonadales bacterium]|nr:hypothetical protein [Gemmatimonadales bacterium]
MSLEIFTGNNLPQLLTTIRTAMGPDACVVQLRRKGEQFELIASDGTGQFAAPEASRIAEPVRRAPAPVVPAAPRAPIQPDFRDVLADRMEELPVARPTPRAVPVQPAAAKAERPAYMVRPWIVALVGPTGAGKTTTIAKLATNADGFLGSRVGLLGLDTYRIGAVEQLETYADLANLPVEIVYSTAELAPALARLNDCEVILVDTPGRSPRNAADTETIRGWLAQIAPDEVHLTLPAGQLAAVSRRSMRSFASFGVTHLLATKLDENPTETVLFNLAAEHGRPMRWITDGQEVPADLRTAVVPAAAGAWAGAA